VRLGGRAGQVAEDGRVRGEAEVREGEARARARRRVREAQDAGRAIDATEQVSVPAGSAGRGGARRSDGRGAGRGGQERRNAAWAAGERRAEEAHRAAQEPSSGAGGGREWSGSEHGKQVPQTGSGCAPRAARRGALTGARGVGQWVYAYLEGLVKGAHKETIERLSAQLRAPAPEERAACVRRLSAGVREGNEALCRLFAAIEAADEAAEARPPHARAPPPPPGGRRGLSARARWRERGQVRQLCHRALVVGAQQGSHAALQGLLALCSADFPDVRRDAILSCPPKKPRAPRPAPRAPRPAPRAPPACVVSSRASAAGARRPLVAIRFTPPTSPLFVNHQSGPGGSAEAPPPR
jgi:hypothetical protein